MKTKNVEEEEDIKPNAFHVKLTSFNLSGVSINFNKSFEFLINVRAIHLFAFIYSILSFYISHFISSFLSLFLFLFDNFITFPFVSQVWDACHQYESCVLGLISKVMFNFRMIHCDCFWSRPQIHSALVHLFAKSIWRSIVCLNSNDFSAFEMNTMTYFDWKLYNRSNFLLFLMSDLLSLNVFLLQFSFRVVWYHRHQIVCDIVLSSCFLYALAQKKNHFIFLESCIKHTNAGASVFYKHWM